MDKNILLIILFVKLIFIFKEFLCNYGNKFKVIEILYLYFSEVIFIFYKYFMKNILNKKKFDFLNIQIYLLQTKLKILY